MRDQHAFGCHFVARIPLTIVFIMVGVSTSAYAAQPWITGYFTAQNGYQSPSEIPWDKYTHIIHFYASPNGGQLTPPAGGDQAEIGQLIAARPAGKKVLICVGDGAGGSFADSTSSGNIDSFVQSVAGFVQTNGYDGVDFDWEQGLNSDQYTSLIQKTYAEFSRRFGAGVKEITMSIYDDPNYITTVRNCLAQIDQVNFMNYDMDIGNSTFTWYNCAIINETGVAGQWLPGMNYNMNYYTSQGIPASKLGVGLPFYCRKWTPATGPLQSGGFAKSTLFYRDLSTDPSRWQSANMHWDATHQAQYLSVTSANPPEFIAYTGVEQINAAVAFMKNNGFGGMMTFTTEYEYISSASGDARYPLSTALAAAVNGGNPPPPPPTIVSFTANPNSIAAGAAVTLSWQTNDATTLTLDNGIGDVTGETSVTASPTATTTYTLTAANSAGAVTQSVTVTVLASQGPYAYWKLDDGAGASAIDSSGNNHTASLINPAWLATGAVSGGCLSFNGNGQSGSAALDLSSTNVVTLAFWLKWSTYADDDRLAFEFSPNFNGSTTGFMIDPDSSNGGGGQFEAGLHGDAGYNQVLFARPSAGVWHHYALIFNKGAGAAEVTPFVDGAPVAFTQITSSVNSNAFGNDVLNWMSRGGTELFGAGDLDEVRVYTRALSASEIAALATPPATESPYGGTPWPIPGQIEAENYDLGGEGVAYHDTTPGNTGGAYRSDDVDIRACVDTNGGYQVGWTDNGEWLNYTVNVASAGNYTFTGRIADGGNPGALHVEFDGANVTGSIAVPNTGSWDTWQNVSATVNLTAGQHILRVVIETGGFDMNYFTFAPPNTPPVITSAASASPNPAIVGQTISFSTAASDPDGDPLSYSWDFGDGSGGSGASVSHAYAAAGNYTATVSVSDGQTAPVSSSIGVTIGNPVQNSVHVTRIAMALSTTTKGKAAIVRITIKDANGAGVSGATVSGSWSGLTSGNVSGATGSGGVVKFTSTRTRQTGTFTFTVQNVSAPGYTYNSGQNAADSGSITTSGQVSIGSSASPALAASAATASTMHAIDLGRVAVHQMFKLALPVPDSIPAQSKPRTTAAGLPTGVRVSGAFIGGKAKQAGAFTIKVQFQAKAGGETITTTQTYTLTVTR